MSTDLELIQFHYSHYNEKIRWALDWKQLPHRRTSLLPGPHARKVRRLTDQHEVPVVRFGELALNGSARIIDELEERHPESSLFSDDPDLRERALEIQRWFDDDIGPRVRRALFAELVHVPGFIVQVFACDRGPLAQALYRASFPIATRVLEKGMGITDAASIADGNDGTRRGLEYVAQQAGAEGFLVGDRFSVADLTAASLLAPAVAPEGSPMELPKPHPPIYRDWLARWRDHEGAAWVRETYARCRPPSAAI